MAVFTLELDMDYSPETSLCTVAPSPTDTPSRGEGAAVHRLSEMDRLQNNPYFCVFKYARAVKQKVRNETEKRERDWGETPHTPYGRVRLARFPRARPTPRFTDFFTNFEKKTDCFAVYEMDNPYSNCPSKLMDKVRRIVHSKLKLFHFQIKTYYLSDADHQTDNPSHTNNPCLV